MSTVDGAPLADQALAVTAEPLDGAKARHRLTGTVPAGARRALIAVRANIEGSTPSPVDVRISDVSYREDGGKNRVPNARFREGLEGWGPYGSGKVTAVSGKDGAAMRVKAAPKQEVLVDGEPFRVTPGADFDLAATIDVPGKSLGSGYVSVIFLGDVEVARESLWFTAPPLELPVVTTSEDGSFRIPLRGLRPGRYDLVVTYAGDIDHWVASKTERVRVK